MYIKVCIDVLSACLEGYCNLSGINLSFVALIDSIDENGKMQIDSQWKVQYENSIVMPERTVLDIACGEYAGGNR